MKKENIGLEKDYYKSRVCISSLIQDQYSTFSNFVIYIYQ